MWKYKQTIFTASVIGALAIGSTFAVASDEDSLDQLAVVKYLTEASGLGQCRDTAQGRYLRQGDSYVIETTLYAGQNYSLVAAGDGTVRDIDMKIYNSSLDLVAKDTMADAVPIVEVTPRRTGTYHVKVLMYSGYGYSNFMVCYGN